jgi:GNAT superfamily N-acetyltransferase
MLRSMNAAENLLDRPGVTVVGHPDRAESHVSAGYVIGSHFVVTCDPAAETMLRQTTQGMEPTFAGWEQVAASAGGELLGSGRMQLLGSELPPIEVLPDGYSFRRLDRDNPDDLQLIRQLIERSDEDDLDEAEIELDDLDERIDVIVDSNGDIASYSAARPFDMAPEYADIGIMTRPEYRGIGLGSIAVAALSERLRNDGLEPLYRCDEDNVGSIKLSGGLGFEIATQLVAYRFPV